MNVFEHQLDYPFANTLPEPGGVVEVASGVYWVRMPLPFALDHINVWLLRDEIDGQQGWTLIDCGIANDTVRSHWEQLFESALDGLPILRVIVTHCHPDHLGLADWMCKGGAQKRWNVRLWMTLGEYMTGRLLIAGEEENSVKQPLASLFARHGLSADMLEHMRRRRASYSVFVPQMPPCFRRLHEGDELTIGATTWRVVTGLGHSPEHASLYSERARLFIAGDMVLPRISTNVSVFDMAPEDNPLAAYLTSLARYEPMFADTLVLPSHGKPFRGLHARIAQLREHHMARLAEVRDMCATHPCSAAQIVPVMFKRVLDAHQMTFAMGEALAHLNFLWLAGELKRIEDQDGMFRFTR